MPLVPPYIDALRPYVPGRNPEEVAREFGISRVFKLASNENPLGASPMALENMQRHMGALHIYPAGGEDLRRVLTDTYEVRTDNVIVGSGSDAIMANIIR